MKPDNAQRTTATQAQSRTARESIPLSERLAFTASEFGKLFGRSATWGYRQIYAARVKPIFDCGRMLVPRSEIDSFLARRSEYNPRPKPKPKPEPKPDTEHAETGQPS